MENDINDFDDIFLEEDNIILKKNLKVACYIRVSTVEQTEMYWDELLLERIKKFLFFWKFNQKVFYIIKTIKIYKKINYKKY